MDHSWLDSLPDANAESDGFQLEGVLIRAPKGCVRLVSGHLCLDFDVDDIVEVQTAGASEAGILHFGVHVLLRLRAGARLLRACPSDVYKDLIRVRRRPFVMSCRPIIHILPDTPRFRDLEKEFLRRYGLDQKV
jgi:hypothetical protein